MMRYRGVNGSAVELALDPKVKGAKTTVAWWLLTGSWHPLWSQFIISVVHLRPVAGAPPAFLQFPDATHELLVIALNPGTPPRLHDPETLERGATVGHLEPIDVVHQFTATDDEMIQLAELCAKASVDGYLNPSTDDARTALREAWLTACVRTLAHMRGEEHA